jgi:putative two-component system response regulator
MGEAAAALSRSRVLIVDDAAENLRILGETLRDNYTIMFARNGKDALRLAESDTPPDLILMFVVMPGMNGYEACRRLKDSPETSNIPVIFVTAQDDGVDEATGLSLGAQDYIKKPFIASLVRNRVDSAVELKRHRDHLSELVAERTRQLAITQEATIHAMANMAEWRDPETGEHIKRTQDYVRTLAHHLAAKSRDAAILTQEFIAMLHLSAPLHDVGKVAIPDAVLHKPGRLTEEEFEVMKTHTTRGRDMLAATDTFLGEVTSFLNVAKDIAYCHHERWDGKGYPRHLRGEEIPLAARLMSVADVYDALRSKRVYKPGMSHEESAKIIFEGKGTQFDPILIDSFGELQQTFQKIADQYSE